MTYGGELFMRDDPQVLSRRLAAFVRPIPAKVLADRIGCTERTAENIRRGHWPIARHWLALVRTFGRDLTECVFHPDAARPVSQRRSRSLKRNSPNAAPPSGWWRKRLRAFGLAWRRLVHVLIEPDAPAAQAVAA
jgi:hypothetical protein